MGKAGSKYFWLLIPVALVALALAGPRPRAEAPARLPSVPQDPPSLDAWLRHSEAQVPRLRPGTEKLIVWANPENPRRTSYSLIYLPGFAATRKEISPVPERVAKALGINLFLTRFTGCGQGADDLKDVPPSAWFLDAGEALQVGRVLGDKVIVMGTSTGGSFAAWLAAGPAGTEVAGLVLLSPNFAPADRRAGMVLWPWGKQIAHLVLGQYRLVRPENADHERYWTLTQPYSSVVTMMSSVNLIDREGFSKLTAPVLVFLSDGDRTVDERVTRRVFASLPAAVKTLVPVAPPPDRNQHVITGDILNPETVDSVAGRIIDFLRRSLPWPAL
ncbi:MAG TPA: alpha/beta hydrolase [Rectinemataceae bacterium]|nr:alpha/beta hydrolase [Rectinemataceae bacterium]